MRAVKLLIGIVSILLGVGLVAAGTNAILTFGTEGRLQLVSPVLDSNNKSFALVMDLANIDAGFPGSEQLGETTIGARSSDQTSLFIGLSTTAQVDKYLAGVPYDVIRHEGTEWETASVPGIKKPGFPKEQKIWTRRSTGSAPVIDFTRAPGGNTTFVVMNADASKGVTARVTIGYKSSLIFPLAIAAISVGGLLILFPLILGYRGRRKRARARVQPTVSMPVSSAESQQTTSQSPTVWETSSAKTLTKPTPPPEPEQPPATPASDEKPAETPLNELDKWFRDGDQK